MKLPLKPERDLHPDGFEIWRVLDADGKPLPPEALAARLNTWDQVKAALEAAKEERFFLFPQYAHATACKAESALAAM